MERQTIPMTEHKGEICKLKEQHAKEIKGLKGSCLKRPVPSICKRKQLRIYQKSSTG